MRLVTSAQELWQARRDLRGSLGLVPTMGALHAGHLALVQRAEAENDAVWVSVFVNPLQFGPNEDFQAYPRDLAKDRSLLAAAGVGLVFAPAVDVVYPPDFETILEVAHVSQRLEGERRPGHFRGVATVVAKLFVMVRPDRAYFGEKDAQQLRVIRRLTADLGFDLDIVAVPTVREPDGLALSSRNAYLNQAERSAAACLARGLAAARAAWRTGERDGDRLRGLVLAAVGAEPLARVDYVSLADDATLAELATVAGPALISMAVFIGKTRLIDNIRLAVGQPDPFVGTALAER